MRYTEWLRSADCVVADDTIGTWLGVSLLPSTPFSHHAAYSVLVQQQYLHLRRAIASTCTLALRHELRDVALDALEDVHRGWAAVAALSLHAIVNSAFAC